VKLIENNELIKHYIKMFDFNLKWHCEEYSRRRWASLRSDVATYVELLQLILENEKDNFENLIGEGPPDFGKYVSAVSRFFRKAGVDPQNVEIVVRTMWHKLFTDDDC